MITEKEYHGWKALALTSGNAEIILPEEIGPRVLSCTLNGGKNLFYNVGEELGGKNEPEFKLRGGHRLWHAPEDQIRTEAPDNTPPVITRLAGDTGLHFKAPGPDHCGILKEMTLEALGNGSFKVTHKLTNQNMWPVKCAPWALTVMERGGFSTIPLLPKQSHEVVKLPQYSIIPWPYTDFSLPIWKLFENFIGIDTTHADRSQKIGITNYPGWAAYWQEGGTFVKHAAFELGAEYPDFGSVYESFVCDVMLELETLAPLRFLEENESSELVEYWGLLPNLPKPDSHEAYESSFKPAVESWLQSVS